MPDNDVVKVNGGDQEVKCVKERRKRFIYFFFHHSLTCFLQECFQGNKIKYITWKVQELDFNE